MSKSLGNVITPDQYVAEMGADTVRAYLMFVGPWEQGGEWNDSGISGISRWLNRLWPLVLEAYQSQPVASQDREKAQRELQRITHQTIRKVTEDLEKLKFNTMLAALMEFSNYLAKVKEAGSFAELDWKEATATLLLLLAPTAPHLAEELWQQTRQEYSIHNQSWPRWDEVVAKDEEITLVVQVNGKLRDRITVAAAITEAEAKEAALARERVKVFLKNRKITSIIYVPGRLVNLVVR